MHQWHILSRRYLGLQPVQVWVLHQRHWIVYLQPVPDYIVHQCCRTVYLQPVPNGIILQRCWVSFCSHCQAGFHSTAAGLSSCLSCPPGAYSNTNWTACAACPAGSASAAASACSTNPGCYDLGLGPWASWHITPSIPSKRQWTCLESSGAWQSPCPLLWRILPAQPPGREGAGRPTVTSDGTDARRQGGRFDGGGVRGAVIYSYSVIIL